MLTVQYTSKMKRDYKRMERRGEKMEKLDAMLSMLAEGNPVPAKYNDHELSGKYAGCRECHIEPDWLLLYQVFEDKLILSCTATGTHDDLFKE